MRLAGMDHGFRTYATLADSFDLETRHSGPFDAAIITAIATWSREVMRE